MPRDIAKKLNGGGPYAIMAKDRYGCTKHKKHLPIDGLGGTCCQNQKTILRHDLEDRACSTGCPLPSCISAFSRRWQRT